MPAAALKWEQQTNWRHCPDSTAETSESKAASSISQKFHKNPKDGGKRWSESQTAENHRHKTAPVKWLGKSSGLRNPQFTVIITP